MTLEEAIAHHRWCADNCEGEVRDEQLQMVAWLEELVELRVWNSEFGCSMNDYNRGALKEPCLRLPYGFGEQWTSVELGDGTGYVRLADYERLKAENAKLRELVEDFVRQINSAEYFDCFGGSCEKWGECMESNVDCVLESRARELGIEAGE